MEGSRWGRTGEEGSGLGGVREALPFSKQVWYGSWEGLDLCVETGGKVQKEWCGRV